MSMYPVKDLMTLWSQEKLTDQQAIGQLIQNFLAFFTRLTQLEKRLQALEQRLPDTKS
jgi:hypothetical protein